MSIVTRKVTVEDFERTYIFPAPRFAEELARRAGLYTVTDWKKLYHDPVTYLIWYEVTGDDAPPPKPRESLGERRWSKSVRIMKRMEKLIRE